MSQIPPAASFGGVRPHRATMILVLGILGVLVCQIILGPIAWVMGNKDLKEMDAGRMDPQGRGMTQAGKILGIVGTALGILGIIWVVVWFLFVGVMVAGAAAGAGASNP